MPKFKIFYTIQNNGDGSARVQFHEDKQSAQLACDLEDEGGEPFGENYPRSIELEFDSKGTLLNPSVTKEGLVRDLAERRGEDPDAAVEAFNAAVTPKSKKKPPRQPKPKSGR